MAREYTQSDKVGAVRAVIMHGGFRLAGEALGIPWETIAWWKHRDPEWWDRVYSQVTLELLEGLTEAGQHQALKLRERCIELMHDRLEHGESKLNVKTGTVEKVPVSLTDLTKAYTALGGVKVAPKVDVPQSEEARMVELARIAQEDRDSRPN